MDWIHQFQLFLFDLDGLLVNTEEMHFAAYRAMLANHGFALPWSFHRYCHTAHYHSDKIADEFYTLLPSLKTQEGCWDVLYDEKKKIMLHFFDKGEVQLMPGVAELLGRLAEANIKRCVVTHSPDELVELLRKQLPILNTIPFWVTRNQYEAPKPDPACYIKAMKKYAAPGERVIGFEDTPRGLSALMGVAAKPILISSVDYPEIPEFLEQGALHFSSFTSLDPEMILASC